MDWNYDGKHDWQDDAIFHNVIDSDDSTSNTGGGGSGCGTVLIWIFVIYLVLNFIAKLVY